MKIPREEILLIEGEGVGVLKAKWNGELVRCKDCRHFDENALTPFDGGKCYGYFGKHLGMRELGVYVKANDYCSRGKRK